MKAKTVLAAAFAAALALALAGCGGTASSNASSSGDSAAASSAASASDSAAAAESSAASSSNASQQALVKIETEGMGVISWAYENEEPEFDDDMPIQSAYVNDAYGQTIHIEARDYAEYEGFHFERWNKDGQTYSTDNRIDVLVDGDAEYVAVFGMADEDAGLFVDYGDSEIYTQEDIDAAIDTVMAEFATWTGAQMKRIALCDDATCETDLEYCNSLRDEADPEFTQAIVLSSDFHSPSGEDAEGTAWNPDTDYNDYTWHLARTDGGEWKLLTWGY